MSIKNERGFRAFRDDETAKSGLSFRACEIKPKPCKDEDGNESVIVHASVSSETPYKRYMKDPETGNYVDCWEVLGHKDGEILFDRMAEGLVIQDTHDGDQIGLMSNPELKDGKLSGDIIFGCGKRAQEIGKDAAAGIRKNMSVGYMVEEYKRDGMAEDGLPIFRVTKWMPYEASFVNVPADPNIGVGRQAETKPAAVEPSAQTKGVSIMEKPVNMAERTADQVTEAYRLASVAHMDNAEVREMLATSKEFGEIKEALLAKAEAYQKELAAKPQAAKPAARAEVLDDSERKEVAKHFRLMNVLRFLADGKGDVGFEREISDEIAKRTGKQAQGFYIPSCVRTITAGDPANKGTTGANTIATDLLASEFIESVKDKLVLASAGMRTISGLVGNIEIPKGGTCEGSWISSEGSDAADATPSFGQVQATPHTGGGYVELTRKFLMQTSISAEAFVTTELRDGLAKLFETAGFCGSGSSGQPTGIVNTANVPTESFTAGAPTVENLANMIAKLATENTFVDSIKWVMQPAVWAKLRATYDWQAVKAGDTNVGGVSSGHYLLDSMTKTMEGFPYFMSNLCKAKELLVGDFSQLVMCLWGGTDITVDPYSLSKSGGLRIVALQDCDFVVRNPKAFVRGTTVIS